MGSVAYFVTVSKVDRYSNDIIIEKVVVKQMPNPGAQLLSSILIIFQGLQQRLRNLVTLIQDDIVEHFPDCNKRACSHMTWLHVQE